MWARKEIESYLIDAHLLTRCSGRSLQAVEQASALALAEIRDDVYSRFIGERISERRSSGVSPTTVVKEAGEEFEQIWGEPNRRLTILPPKEYLSALNRHLGRGAQLSARKLALVAEEQDLPVELRSYLHSLEEELS